MAKEIITKEVADEETVVHTHNAACGCSERNSNKPVIIAVGAAVILFIIGLILGYLLGHTNAARNAYGPGMMDQGNSRRYSDDNMPMFRGRGNTGTSQSPSTNSSNTTTPQAQTQTQ